MQVTIGSYHNEKPNRQKNPEGQNYIKITSTSQITFISVSTINNTTTNYYNYQ